MADRPQLSRAAIVVAILVLVAFAGLVAFLIGQVGEDETEWTRLAWVFTSVEAIAFGAAGPCSPEHPARARRERRGGRTRERTARRERARPRRGDQGRGTRRSGPRRGATLESLGAGEQRDAAASIAARHAELAKRLFP